MQGIQSNSSDSLLARDSVNDKKSLHSEVEEIGTSTTPNVRVLLVKSESGTLYQLEGTTQVLYTTQNVKSWKRWDSKSFYRGERGPSSTPFATSKNFTVDMEDPVRGRMVNVSEDDVLYQRSKLSL
jgi:hypothetical protein